MKLNMDRMHHGAFSELANLAATEGYDLSVTEDLHMELQAIDDSSHMPEIMVKTEQDGNVYYFIPTLTFPKLCGADFKYHDDAEYYIECWQKIGRFITQLLEFQYNPSLYE